MQQVENHVFSWLGWSPDSNSKAFKALRSSFPGALPGPVVHARTVDVLTRAPYNLTPENTLYGNSVCPDEINHEDGGLPDIMKKYWGECFPLGGISGAPFVGKTGFKAFSHHVPKHGHVFVLYGPHVGISDKGEVGKVVREGQDAASHSCGAAIGAYQCCLSKGKLDEGWYKEDQKGDSRDTQMNEILAAIAPHAEEISKQTNPMASLAFEAYGFVDKYIHDIVNCDFGDGNLILVGGIQINMPKPYADHFLPLKFEVRSKRRGATPLNLLDAFQCPAVPKSLQTASVEAHLAPTTDGQAAPPLMPVWTQWIFTFLGALSLAWCLATPWLGTQMMSDQANVLFGLPSASLVIALFLSIAFNGSAPSSKIVKLMSLYTFAVVLSWHLGRLPQFIIGSCPAVMFWFYMIVTLMSKESGQGEGDAFQGYAFLAPSAIGFWNVVGHAVEEHFKLPPGARWSVSVAVGFLVNLTAGKLSGTYHFKLAEYVRYSVGSMSLYTFVYFGVIRNLESLILAGNVQQLPVETVNPNNWFW